LAAKKSDVLAQLRDLGVALLERCVTCLERCVTCLKRRVAFPHERVQACDITRQLRDLRHRAQPNTMALLSR
jgi:hypothetical protein